MKCPLEIISYEDSKYKDILIKKNQTHCLIGKVGDVEMVLLHYHDPNEAKAKWIRRCQRVNYENIIFKMSEMNYCTEEHLRAFDDYPTERKVLLVSRDYGLKNQTICPEWESTGEIKNDTVDFKKYVDLVALINGSDKH